VAIKTDKEKEIEAQNVRAQLVILRGAIDAILTHDVPPMTAAKMANVAPHFCDRDIENSAINAQRGVSELIAALQRLS